MCNNNRFVVLCNCDQHQRWCSTTGVDTLCGQESNPAPAKTCSLAVDLSFRRTKPTPFSSHRFGPAASGVATAAPSTDPAVVAAPLETAVVLYLATEPEVNLRPL